MTLLYLRSKNVGKRLTKPSKNLKLIGRPRAGKFIYLFTTTANDEQDEDENDFKKIGKDDLKMRKENIKSVDDEDKEDEILNKDDFVASKLTCQFFCG